MAKKSWVDGHDITPNSIPLDRLAGMFDPASKGSRPPRPGDPTLPTQPTIKPGVLPSVDSYFTHNDSPGAPNPPANVTVGVAFRSAVISWDVPPEAAFREWEVYEGTATGFTPDTTGLTNRRLKTRQTVVTVTGETGTTRYYKVCAVNTRDERSSFVEVHADYTSVPTAELVQDDLTAIYDATLAAAGDYADGAIAAAVLEAQASNEGVTPAMLNAAIATEVSNRNAAIASEIGTFSDSVADDIDAARLAAIDASLTGEFVGTFGAGVIYGGQVLTTQLTAGTALIGNALIGDLAATKITAGTLQAGVIYGGQVLTNQLVAGTALIGDALIGNLNASHIQTGTINASVVWGGTIGTNKLVASGALIGRALIADLAVGTAQIDNLAVTNAKIQSLSADKITAGTIDASVINVTNLDAAKIRADTFDGIDINGVTITGSTFIAETDPELGVALEINEQAITFIQQGAGFEGEDLWLGGIRIRTLPEDRTDLIIESGNVVGTNSFQNGAVIIGTPEEGVYGALEAGAASFEHMSALNFDCGTFTADHQTAGDDEPHRVNFHHPFSAPPCVVATVASSVPSIARCGVTDIDETGFTMNIYRTNTTLTGTRWIAMLL